MSTANSGHNTSGSGHTTLRASAARPSDAPHARATETDGFCTSITVRSTKSTSKNVNTVAAPLSALTKILLIPVDGSTESGAAFDYAVKQTSSKDTLILFHGEPQVFHLTGSGGMVVVVEPDSTASKNSSVLKASFTERCTLMQRNCEWIAKSFVGGSSAVAADIVKVAEERKAEGIVMGARGLSALGSVMLGSVSQSVLQRAQMPVTVVKSEVRSGEAWKAEQHTL